MEDARVSEEIYNLNKWKLPKHIIKDGAKWIIMAAKTVLDGVSVWPETQDNLTRVLHVFYLTSYLFIFVGQVNHMVDKDSNLVSVCYTMLLTILVIETTRRRILCYCNKEKFNKILYNVYYEFWPSTIAGNELHEELSKYTWYLCLFCFGYTTSAIVSALQIMTVPYFKDALPFSATYFFAWRKSPWYELLYIWQAALMMELVSLVCGFDLFFLSLLCNCIAQLKLLRAFILQDFAEIIKRTENHTDGSIRRREIQKSLVLCIQHHQRIIHVCKELEEAFTYFVLVQFLASVLTVCVSTFVTEFQVVIQEDIFLVFTYLIGHISEILIFCYMGSDLLNESTKLSDTIFHCGWHNEEYDASIQKSLVMVMIRSQNPIRISVGGFGILSLSGFLKLIQFSFSMYSFLNTLMMKQVTGDNK